LDILHAMKDALMKYETIDALQIDDLMARTDVRQPADWDDNDSGSSSNTSKGDDSAAKKPDDVASEKQEESKQDNVSPDLSKPSDSTAK